MRGRGGDQSDAAENWAPNYRGGEKWVLERRTGEEGVKEQSHGASRKSRTSVDKWVSRHVKKYPHQEVQRTGGPEFFTGGN